MTIIYKTFKFEKSHFEENEEFFMFEGYLSTFGTVDRGNDVVVKGAFIESLKVHKPSLFWSHNPEQPIGVFDELREDDKGLFVKGRMPKDDAFVRDRMMPQMKIGSIKSMSIGFGIEDWATDTEMVDGVRFLKKVTLWEGSLVTIPMNPEATIKRKMAVLFQDDLPIADRSHPWDSLSAIGRLREWAGVDNGGLIDPSVQNQYKQAFLWYDKDFPEFLDAYALPIADIIGGRLVVIPRAIFSAAARVKGDRVWLPYEDLPSIRRTIEKYFEKMAIDSPFSKSAFRIDDLSSIDPRTMEKLFNSGVSLSQKASKTLVSYVKAGLNRDEGDPEQSDSETKTSSEDWSKILNEIKSIK
jgi:HK97 family phage prohead protease